MLEGKLTDEEIRDLWIAGFAQRHESPRSKALCDLIRMIVELRAAEYAEVPEQIVEAVHHKLDALGISRDEYYQVKRRKPKSVERVIAPTDNFS